MATQKNVVRTKWSKPQLQKYIREESEISDNVIFLDHVLKRMKERHITKSMALDTLRKGLIKLTPEFDSHTLDIKCRMEYYVAGKDVKMVVAVSDDNPNLVLVTAI